MSVLVPTWHWVLVPVPTAGSMWCSEELQELLYMWLSEDEALFVFQFSKTAPPNEQLLEMHDFSWLLCFIQSLVCCVWKHFKKVGNLSAFPPIQTFSRPGVTFYEHRTEVVKGRKTNPLCWCLTEDNNTGGTLLKHYRGLAEVRGTYRGNKVIMWSFPSTVEQPLPTAFQSHQSSSVNGSFLHLTSLVYPWSFGLVAVGLN